MPSQNDNEDPSIKDYLTKILFSIFVTFAWMWTNTILGIFMGWAYAPASLIEEICFYSWLVISSAGLFIIYIKIWRKSNDAE